MIKEMVNKEMEMREAIKVMEQDLSCYETYFKALEEGYCDYIEMWSDSKNGNVTYYGYYCKEAEEIIEAGLEDFEKFLKIECGCYENEDEIIVNQLTVPKEVLFNNIDFSDDSLRFYYNSSKNNFKIEMSNCIKFVVEAI